MENPAQQAVPGAKCPYGNSVGKERGWRGAAWRSPPPSRHLPVAISGGGSGGGGGSGCSSRLCVSVGCVSTLQERGEPTLHMPLPRGAGEHTPAHTQMDADADTDTDTNTDTSVGRECFKLHQSACYSLVYN